MKIEANKYYKFANDDHKKQFLERVRKITGCYHFEIDKFMKPEKKYLYIKSYKGGKCGVFYEDNHIAQREAVNWFPYEIPTVTGYGAELKIIDDPVKTDDAADATSYLINYYDTDIIVTRDMSKFVKSITSFDTIKLPSLYPNILSKPLLNQMYGKMGLGGPCKMNKLIEKAQKQELDALTKELQTKCEKFIENTTSGKALVEAVRIMNTQKTVDVKWQKVFGNYMLTDEDTAKVDAMEEEFRKKAETICEKYTECHELFELAEEFTDQQAILKQYGILKFGKKVTE